MPSEGHLPFWTFTRTSALYPLPIIDQFPNFLIPNNVQSLWLCDQRNAVRKSVCRRLLARVGWRGWEERRLDAGGQGGLLWVLGGQAQWRRREGRRRHGHERLCERRVHHSSSVIGPCGGPSEVHYSWSGSLAQKNNRNGSELMDANT